MEPDLAEINCDLTLLEIEALVKLQPDLRKPKSDDEIETKTNEPNRVEEGRKGREKTRIDRRKNGSGRDGDGSSGGRDSDRSLGGRDGDGSSRVCLFSIETRGQYGENEKIG
ncbi:hypothetical protein L484_003814 [Morus notabilis]|uniref:Uncharacterized protein n=1 Tax=Morus notabilis TaxID=981085 RepID=W9SE78_9ROSA|nr:hypothetical protein L484_003814 [Morus notabilis]